MKHFFSRVHATLSHFVRLSVSRSVCLSLNARSTQLMAIGLVKNLGVYLSRGVQPVIDVKWEHTKY